jgi:hypothetical protein
MIVSLNQVFLRQILSALARAIYTIDFSQYLECSPNNISEILEEESKLGTRSIKFNIDKMDEVFQDVNFRHIFKLYIGNSSFPPGIRNKVSGIQYYKLLILEERSILVNILCDRFGITSTSKDLFVSKFTEHLLQAYFDRVKYLINKEEDNNNRKENKKKEEVKLLRSIPVSSALRSLTGGESSEGWIEAKDHRNNNNNNNYHIVFAKIII